MTGPMHVRHVEQVGTDQPYAAAVKAFAQTAQMAVGFCYSPVRAQWFRITDGAAHGPNGPLDLTGVFELRAFNRDRELRWWNTSGGRGPAVVVTERAGDPDGDAPRRVERPYARLLWGTRERELTAPAGWVRLLEGRIGTIEVPFAESVAAGGRVWLHAVEYVEEDEHGNVAVVDERLVGLSAIGVREAAA